MTDIPNVGSWLTEAPWRDRSVSLIRIDLYTLVATQAHTLADKREMLTRSSHASDRRVLLVAWTGKWRTDVRRIAHSDVQGILDAIG
jgi:hypothetical protein